jgi:putative ABC transport system permease protein
MFYDCQFAIRSLRRRPGFVALAVCSVGLAIAVCTVTSSVIDAAEHPYVPFGHPEQLYWVNQRGDGNGKQVTEADKYAALSDGSDFYRGLGYESGNIGAVTGAHGAETDWVESVSSNFFAVLEVTPELGRTPGGAESNGEAVVSHALWQRLYAGRPALDDAHVTVDDHPYSIVGVLPPGMPEAWGADVWLSLAPGAEVTDPVRQRLRPVVRLKAGVTAASASPQLAVLASRLTASYGTGQVPFAYDLWSVAPEPMPLKATHGALLGAALSVLLIACANLANLMLARGLAQRREFALRLALGATRAALVRQIVTELSIVAVAGAVLGCWAALGGMRLVMHRIPPQVFDVGVVLLTLNWRVFAFTLAATASTIMLGGLVPALRMTGVAIAEPLKDAAGTTTGRVRRYSPLIIAEVALAMTLAMGAGLLVKAAHRVNGYDTAHLLSTWVDLGSGRHRSPESAATASRDVIARIGHVDGVESAASLTFAMPPGRIVESALPGGGNRRLLLHAYAVVSPDFLRTLGIGVVAGRDFEDGDASAGSGAVVVDQSAARLLWPHGGAIGGQVRFGDGTDVAWLPVIGIARRASLDFEADPDLPAQPMIYAVLRTDDVRFHRIAVRLSRNETPGSTARVALAVHRAIGIGVPGAGAYVSPWQDYFRDLVAGRDFVALLFSLLGALALGLSAVGLYGVLAYTVSRRMREFGIRLALGARREDVFRLVIHDGAVMVLAGTGLGAIFAMWVSKLLSVWLYGVHPTDAGGLVGAEVLLILVSLAACLAPALRAMRAEPLEILRAA